LSLFHAGCQVDPIDREPLPDYQPDKLPTRGWNETEVIMKSFRTIPYGAKVSLHAGSTETRHHV